MNILYGHSAEVAEFVAALIPGCNRGFGPCQAIGITDDDGRLIAGVVFHNWSPEHGVIEMSSASTTPRWLTRRTLKHIFSYCFDGAGCQLVVARVAETNKRLQRIFSAYGFRATFIPRLRGRNEGEIIFTLGDDEWRLNGFHRKD